MFHWDSTGEFALRTVTVCVCVIETHTEHRLVGKNGTLSGHEKMSVFLILINLQSYVWDNILK